MRCIDMCVLLIDLSRLELHYIMKWNGPLKVNPISRDLMNIFARDEGARLILCPTAHSLLAIRVHAL